MMVSNILRFTTLAFASFFVLIACDNRGVTAMKARMFTPEERAQARALMTKNRPSNADVPTGQAAKTPETPAKAPKAGDPDDVTNQKDQPEEKVFSEPTNAAKTAAAIKVEELKAFIAPRLGVPNEDAINRIRGITIEKVLPQFGKSTLHLSAIIHFRGHDQNLFVTTDVDVNAKDVVMGTSNVNVTNLGMIKEKDAPITTDDLLISTVCLEVNGATCAHSYLLIQIGNDGEKLGAAVFELDKDLRIVNSNLGEFKSFTEAQNAAALDSVTPPTPAVSGAVATLGRIRGQAPWQSRVNAAKKRKKNAKPSLDEILRAKANPVFKPATPAPVNLGNSSRTMNGGVNTKTLTAPGAAPIVAKPADAKAATPVAPKAEAKAAASTPAKPTDAKVNAPAAAKPVDSKAAPQKAEPVKAAPATTETKAAVKPQAPQVDGGGLPIDKSTWWESLKERFRTSKY